MAALIGKVSRLLGMVLVSMAMGAPAAYAQDVNGINEIIKRGTLKVGWAVYFPYAYRDPQTKELRGITVEIVNDMAAQLKVKPQFVEDSWATLIAGLQSQKYDLTMPLAVTLQRAMAVAYTDPMTRINFGLMVRKEDAPKFSSWTDVDKTGMRISTTLGSSAQPLLSKFKNAKVILVKDGPTSINDVLSKRADAWLNTLDAFKFVEKEHPNLRVVPGAPVGHQDIAMAARVNDTVLRDWVTLYIREIKNTGKLLGMIEKHGLNESYIAD